MVFYIRIAWKSPEALVFKGEGIGKKAKMDFAFGPFFFLMLKWRSQWKDVPKRKEWVHTIKTHFLSSKFPFWKISFREAAHLCWIQCCDIIALPFLHINLELWNNNGLRKALQNWASPVTRLGHMLLNWSPYLFLKRFNLKRKGNNSEINMSDRCSRSREKTRDKTAEAVHRAWTKTGTSGSRLIAEILMPWEFVEILLCRSRWRRLNKKLIVGV